MNPLLARAMIHIIAVTVAALLFLIFCTVFRKRSSAVGRYIAGIILAASFLLPLKIPVFRIDIPRENIAQLGKLGETMIDIYSDTSWQSVPVTDEEPLPEVPDISLPAEPSHTDKTPFPYEYIVFAVYITGLLCSLFLTFFRYCRTVKTIKRYGRKPNSEELRILLSLCDKSKISRAPVFIVSPHQIFHTPVMFGILHRYITVPDDMSQESFGFIARHELEHCKRHDNVFKILFSVLKDIYWFNPVMYLFSRTMNDLCEEACDESLLAGSGMKERKLYGRYLILSAATSAGVEKEILFTAFKGGKKQMKKRFTNILSDKKKKGCTVVITVVLAILLSVAVYAAVEPEAVAPPVAEIQNVDCGEPVSSDYKMSILEKALENADFPGDISARALKICTYRRSSHT